MRNTKDGESLKDTMYSGLDVSDDFKRVYGEDLDKYADKYEGIKKKSRDAKISVKDFNDEIVKGGKEAVVNTSLMQDFGSGLANVGKTALSIAGDVGLNVLISAGLTAAGEAWDNYSNKQENAIEKGNEALSNYKQTNQDMQSATSWVKENGERFTELSQKATQLGEQGKLTNSEFQEYNQLSAQAAEYFPKLVTGYNSENTPITSLGKNATSLDDALSTEKLNKYSEAANNAKDVISKFKAEMYQDAGLTKEIGITNQQDAIKSFLDDYDNKDYGGYGNKIKEAFENNGDGLTTGRYSYLNNANLKAAFKEAGIKGSAWFGQQYTQDDFLNPDNIQTLRNYYEDLQSQAENSVSAIKEVMPAFFQEQEDYQKLIGKNSNLDTEIGTMLTGLNQDSIERILGGKINDMSDEEVVSGIRNWSKKLVNNLQDQDTQDAFANLFSVNDDKTSLSFKDYEKKATDAVDAVAKKTKAFTKDELKQQSGITDSLDEMETAYNNISDRFGKDKGFSEDYIKNQMSTSDMLTLGSMSTDDQYKDLSYNEALSNIQSVQEKSRLSLENMQKVVTDTTTAYSSLSTAVSESASNTGMTDDSIQNIKSSIESLLDDNDELKDFDLNSLFTNTAKGVKLNNDKLKDMLELQHNLRSKDFADSIKNQTDEIKKQESALKDITKGTDEYTAAQEKLNTARNELAETKQARSQYHAQYQQQQQLLSEYAQWQRAQSTENAGDKYNNLFSGLKTAKSDFDKGLIGTDDFKTFAKMISPSGSTDPENFAENYGKAARYITEDESGLVHFFEDLSHKTDEAGNQMAKFNDQTQQWELNVHDLGEVAQKLGTGETVVEALFGRAEDYGATSTVISDQEDGILKTTEAIQNKAEAQARLNQMEEANKQAQAEGKDDIYNTTAIEAARQEVEKYQAQIDGLKESMEYLSEHSGTDNQAKEAKTATDEIKQMKQEYDSLMEEANGNTESTAYKTAQQLKDSIQQKANESNLELDAELNVTGVKASAQEGLQKAQESGQISSDINLDYDKSSMSLDQLNSKIQELNNEKVRIQTEADTSGSEETLNQLDTEISALQSQKVQVEIDTALNNGNTVDELLAMSDEKLMTTVGCDASEVETVRSELQSMQGEAINMSVKMDSTQFASLINAITGETVEVPVEANTDGAVQETTSAIEGSNPKVTPEVDTSNVESATQNAVQNAAQGAKVELPSVDVVGHVTEITAGQGLQDVAIKGNVVQISGNPSQPVDVKGNITDVTGNPSGQVDVHGNVINVSGSPSGTVDVKGNVTSVSGNPSGTVNVKGNITTGKVENANGTVSNGTINYKKGSVEKADGTTSQGIINYKKGDVEKADGTVSTGVINYDLGNVATPTGMVATGVINYTLGTVAKPKASGTFSATRAYAQGSLSDFFFSPTPAHATGDVALDKNETALVNEVGIESIVRDGRWSLIPGGAHLVNLKKGDIVFSASQTEDLLKRGATPGHARAYAQGSLSDFSLAPAHAVGGMTLGFSGGLKSPKYGNSGGGSSSTPSTTPANTSAQQDNTNATNDNTKSTKENTKAAKHSSTVFEWVERSIKKFKDAVENISNKINDYVTSAFKTSLLKQQISALQQEINANKRGQKTYMDKANSIANGYTYYYTPEGSDTEQTMNIVIPDSYKQAVQGGYWNIEDMDTTSDFGKGLAEAIQKYQDYYDKATDCSQAVQELYNEQLKVFEQWANMPTEEAEKKLDKLTNKLNGIKSASTAVSTGGSGLQSLISQIKSDTGLGTAERKLASAKKAQSSAKKKASTANKNYATATKEANSAKSTMTSRGKSIISIAKKANVSSKKQKEIQNAVKNGKAINTKGLTGNTLKAAKQYNSSRKVYNQDVKEQTAAKKKKVSANKAYTKAKKNVRTQQTNVNKITNSLTSAQRKVLNNKDAKYAYVPQNAMLDQQTAEAKQENAVRQAALKKANKNVESYEKHISSRNNKRDALLQNKKLTKAQKAALKANKNINTSKITDKKIKAQIESYNKANKTVKSEATKYRILKDAQSKAQSAADQSQAEYAAMRVTNEQEKFKNIQSYYDDKFSLYKGYTESHQKKYEKSETHGNYASSKKYTTQITDLNKERTIQAESAKKLQAQLNSSVKKGIIKKGSLEWIQLTAQINEAKNAVSDLDNEIEQAKQDQITTLYEEMFDRAIEKANQLKDKIGTINDLITDDMMIDKDTGNLTEMGMLSIALNSNQLDTELGNIQTYVKKRQQIMDDFADGSNKSKYGEKTYDDMMAENDSAMQNAIQSANNYRNSILKIITSQAQAVQDALFKQMDAYKKALKKKKEYYDYDKQLKKKNSEIELLDQQIAALEGVTDAESKAMKAKLEAQRKEKQDDLNDTVRDHVYDLQVNGLDDLKDQLSEDFEKWSNQLSSDLKKMSDAISSAISNSGMDYDDMQKAISKILEQFGLNPNDYFTSKDNTSIKNSNRMDSGYNSGHLQGYAKGTKRVGGSPRVVMTNENGREIIVTKKGILTPVEPSDGIIPNDMTETLMQMAMNYRNFDIPEIKMPDVQIVNKDDSNGGGNVYNHYDSLLTVQGDVTKDALPDLKTILKQASEYTQNDIRKNKRRFG